MKGQSIFFVHSTHKTKTWWVFLSVLVLVFVPFLIVWLLNGEFNLLSNDWIIAKGASVWHGTVRADNIDALVRDYLKFYDGTAEQMRQQLMTEYLNKTASIDSYRGFFEPIMLAPLLGLLLWSIAFPIIFNATKLSGLDVIPFSFGMGSFMTIMVLNGLMPQWGANLLALYWIVRLFIALICTVIVFILANYFVNKYIANSSYSTDIYFGYKSIDQENALAKEQLKENLDIFKHHKDSQESYVEVKDGE